MYNKYLRTFCLFYNLKCSNENFSSWEKIEKSNYMSPQFTSSSDTTFSGSFLFHMSPQMLDKYRIIIEVNLLK